MDGPEEQLVSSGLMTTGRMARLSGSTLRTVRFYEEEGLLTPVERSEGGHRLYRPEQLQELKLILDLREAGLSLADIKNLFSLKGAGSCPEEASRDMSDTLERQIGEMQRKMDKLKQLQLELTHMVERIRRCQQCSRREQFPRVCQDCDVVCKSVLPRALRVLWGR